MNKFEELEKLCKKFDWYYQRADDRRDWSTGIEKQKELERMIFECEKVNLKRTKDIVKKYQRKHGVIFYR